MTRRPPRPDRRRLEGAPPRGLGVLCAALLFPLQDPTPAPSAAAAPPELRVLAELRVPDAAPELEGGGEFGHAAVLFDADGDGVLDVAASEPRRGVVWVFFGPDFERWQAATARGFAPPGELPEASGATRFGNALAVLPGEDGARDALAVGAPDADAGRGRIVLLELQTEVRSLASEHPDTRALGSSLVMGDFDADGRLDVASGAPSSAAGNAPAVGSLHLFDADGVEQRLANPGLRTGEADRGSFGSALAAARGADGRWSLYVSASGNDASGITNAGRVYAYDAPVSAADVQALADPEALACDRPGTRFGKKLSARGGLLSIGAPRKDLVRGGACAKTDTGGSFLVSLGPTARVTRLVDPEPRVQGLLGFHTLIADLVGDEQLDVLFVKLGTRELVIHTRGATGRDAHLFELPEGSEYPVSLVAGQVVAGGREELLVGDNRYDEHRGRVLLLAF